MICFSVPKIRNIAEGSNFTFNSDNDQAACGVPLLLERASHFLELFMIRYLPLKTNLGGTHPIGPVSGSVPERETAVFDVHCFFWHSFQSFADTGAPNALAMRRSDSALSFCPERKNARPRPIKKFLLIGFMFTAFVKSSIDPA
jgi:hypothetical protein